MSSRQRAGRNSRPQFSSNTENLPRQGYASGRSYSPHSEDFQSCHPRRSQSRDFNRGSVGRGRSGRRSQSRGFNHGPEERGRSGVAQDVRRGSQSFESLHNSSYQGFPPRGGRGRGGKEFGGDNGSRRKDRQYPIGFKELERLLTIPADGVTLELLRENSGYHLLMDDDNLKEEKFLLLVKVLAYATDTKSNRECLAELFIKTCNNRFMDRLCSFSMVVKMKYQKDAIEYFTNLFIFLNAYANALINTAIDKVPSVVGVCIAVLNQMDMVSEELVTKYVTLQDMLTESAKKWEQDCKSDILGRKTRQEVMEEMEPPDDFTLMSVLPTPQDLVQVNRPFLRRNIVEGKYQSELHYLDVQFRLLREDFVRPLRNGISDFRGDTKSRFQDIRIYRNVNVVGTMFKNRKMMHLIKLNLPKHIQSMENSKRLMFGNLLCLSHNNFKTLIFASVAERDAEMFRKDGVIGVQFESDIKEVDLLKKFVMAESKAYFMAYKHVLKALQDMAANGMAMTPYIVHVEKNVDPPDYLGYAEKYDLRVVKNMNWMKKDRSELGRHNIHNRLLLFNAPTNAVELDDAAYPHLSEVFVRRDLISWPAESDLGLDSSQRKALRSALTRKLAIIQGPPGTGKTFIGLKVTQILLHNSSVWKAENRPTPILVVCFTNHALDQFLEGMTEYTNKIVRVGSRTKSESISRFQVNSLVRSVQRSHCTPRSIHEMHQTLHLDLTSLEQAIGKLRATVTACKNPMGIFFLQNLAGEDIIPPHIYRQLSQVGIVHWLLLSINPDVETMEKQKNTFGYQTPLKKNMDVEESGYDHEVLDVEELMVQDEQDRLLDGGDDFDDEDIKSYDVSYEISDEMISTELDESSLIMQQNPNNFGAAFKCDILFAQRKSLRMGLSLTMDLKSVKALESKPRLNIMWLDFPSRWRLYKFWLSKLEVNVGKELSKLEAKYQRRSRALLETKNQEILHVMRQASVVGMTTTGAAQHSAIMEDLAPAIVIIEEAAEILESHVITSLTSKCQHLIMIGDHQQLRPSATVYELAKKYGLETSLFERMIKNGLPYETLEYQHRMRPSISRLLVPSIYKELKDHPSVSKYPSIKGLVSNVFFIDHDIPEREESDDNNSHENQHEAEFIIGLCRHLVLQGYEPEKVTILTPYSGQFFLLRKLQRHHTVCQGVRICVVDNFQGEENDIILLSLVRSNVEGKVGFLSTDNRVCVALSRAKHGLYITGNMDMLKSKTELWKKIHSDLVEGHSFGSSLTLKCQNHPHQLMEITKGSDFSSKAPEGGCLQSCNKNLPKCAHACPRQCHMDDLEHIDYNCRVPCPKRLCDLDHQCPKLCYEKCSPCEVGVDKVCPCGHTNCMPCHVDAKKFQCPQMVERVLDHCQHEVKMACWKDTKSFPCPHPCDTRLDCGHQCNLKCHMTNDPDHTNYNCKKNCTSLNAGCLEKHPCLKYCYEECGTCITNVNKQLPCGHEAKNVECYILPDSIECKANCKKTLSCGHACKKLCFKNCDPCPVRVKKTVQECNHEVLVECGSVATTKDCDGKCKKLLPCGHLCVRKCKDDCTTECKKEVTSTTKCPRGHFIKLPCHLVDKVTGEKAWKLCDAPCQQQLDCEHQCMGQCGHCFQGRLHVPCKNPCSKVLVCGHICTHPCGADCPPCQMDCSWKCKHSKCRKECGKPCTPCKETCPRKCAHRKCTKKCGEPCSVLPCQDPCPKKLKCGHDCVGFCGDPCPPLCRICNQAELTEFFLLGNEEDTDSRFVLLEDCGHSIEVEGLEGWLKQESETIGMKTCPRCRKPIYNNGRYKEIIYETYKDVNRVKSKYYLSEVKNKRKYITQLLKDQEVYSTFPTEIEKISSCIGLYKKKKNKYVHYTEAELHLYLFQAQILKKASNILKKERMANPSSPPLARVRNPLFAQRANAILEQRTPPKHNVRLYPKVKEVVEVVMKKSLNIAPQMVNEVSGELERLVVLPAYWTFLDKVATTNSTQLQSINSNLVRLMDPTVKYTNETDVEVRQLLKESEKHLGGLGISDQERLMIVQAIGLKQGHWYKCPNGHVYCITECGGAVVEGRCHECGSTIGGGGHRLRADNAVAREMDGAQHPAWSEHNNLGNFDLDNI